MWEGGVGEWGWGAAALEPVSHKVFVVLGVAAVERCIVEVVFHLCFQSSGQDRFLLLLAFVLL